MTEKWKCHSILALLLVFGTSRISTSQEMNTAILLDLSIIPNILN
jgi:hypothetical protein